MKPYGNEKLNPSDTAAQIISPITQALKSHNITLDRIASKFNALMDCGRISTDKDGNQINIPDNPTQLKATIESGKLLQAYPAERKEILTDTLEDRLRRLRSPVGGKTEGET